MIDTRICQNCKVAFTIDPADFDFYEKIKVPPPTWCAQCRLQRRLSFFNERVLYKVTCALCGKKVMSMYAPDSGLVVYCNACYWSDNWDPGAYFAEYNPDRPFLAQVHELIRKTPQVALSTNYPTLMNSDYINHSATSKNCYLIFTADNCENTMYSTVLDQARDSMDCMNVMRAELSYQSINVGRVSRAYFSDVCSDCTDISFCSDCRGCDHCFGCINLRKKSYHFFNEPLSKEEYHRRVSEFALHTRAGLAKAAKQVREFWATKPHRAMHLGSKNVNTTGEYVFSGSKNSRDMYYVLAAEDSRFCQFLTMPTTKDCYDYSMWGNMAERVYDSLIVGEGARDIRFSNQCWGNVLDVEYSFWATGSSHMFGCANIRKKQYCVLNKQYSKEEYDELRKKIIDDMNRNPYRDAAGRTYPYGEFFPTELSLHTYNETQANDFFPMTEREALDRGYRWKTLPRPLQEPTIHAASIPDDITQTPDFITNEILECAACRRPYRIIPAELQLLKRFQFPVPQHCFNCRHEERMKHRLNPPRLWDRVCAKCGSAIKTSYAPDRPEIVCCEACYQQEIS